MSIDRYNEIIDLSDDFNPITITSHIPHPTKSDYDVGYITRYFVQKANDKNSLIYEISRSFYDKVNDNPFYLVAILDWRLIGDPNEIKKSNSASIRIASEVIPKIYLYLPNLLQFYKK